MRSTKVFRLLPVLLLTVSMTGVASAQTPATDDPREQWWTAWSDCDATPVQSGAAPKGFAGKPDELFWLQAESTNDSGIELVVWLWTGNRPLPLDGVYASEELSAKWLWQFSERVSEISMAVTNETGDHGEVSFGAPLTAYDYQWPSIVVVPEAGCWTFEIDAVAVDGRAYAGRIVFPAVP